MFCTSSGGKGGERGSLKVFRRAIGKGMGKGVEPALRKQQWKEKVLTPWFAWGSSSQSPCVNKEIGKASEEDR